MSVIDELKHLQMPLLSSIVAVISMTGVTGASVATQGWPVCRC
eukprot:COSAG05_NODE_1139_length_5741_cov_7.808401_2_plen_43_part_00